MKTLIKLCILTLLVVIVPDRCFALMSIAFVDKKKADELGIKLTITPNGPDAAVVALEFKTNGPLATFHHVSIEIRDDRKFLLGWTPLQHKVTDSGSIKAGLTANREYLNNNITLRIVAGSLGDIGYDLRLKDFVEPPKSASTVTAEEEARFLAAVKKAFDAHDSSHYTKEFREKIQPLIGSPWDERLHQIIKP